MTKLFLLVIVLISLSCSTPIGKYLTTPVNTTTYTGKYINLKKPDEFIILRQNNVCYSEFHKYGFDINISNANCRYEIENGDLYIYWHTGETNRAKFDNNEFQINKVTFTKDNSAKF